MTAISDRTAPHPGTFRARADARPSEAEAPTVLQLIYASAATTPWDDHDLDALLAQSRANNTRLGVTGMLLYADGSFIQALEGPPDVVEALYERIAADPRHNSCILLHRGIQDHHSFDEWSMGFERLEPDDLHDHPGLNRFLETGLLGISLFEEGELVRRTLIGFREGRFRRG